MKAFSQQFLAVFRQGLRQDFTQAERIIAPVLFSALFLLLFSFSVGEVDKAIVYKIFVAETFLALFFGLQISFSRVFEPEQQDSVFALMRSYPINASAWFCGKYALVLLHGISILLPVMGLAAIFNGGHRLPLFQMPLVGIALMVMLGVSALGILLSTLTMQSGAKQILYPLLYFPLTVPVFLAAVQSSLGFLESGKITDDTWQWLGLLMGFDMIYITLSILLFGELVKSE